MPLAPKRVHSGWRSLAFPMGVIVETLLIVLGWAWAVYALWVVAICWITYGICDEFMYYLHNKKHLEFIYVERCPICGRPPNVVLDDGFGGGVIWCCTLRVSGSSRNPDGLKEEWNLACALERTSDVENSSTKSMALVSKEMKP